MPFAALNDAVKLPLKRGLVLYSLCLALGCGEGSDASAGGGSGGTGGVPATGGLGGGGGAAATSGTGSVSGSGGSAGAAGEPCSNPAVDVTLEPGTDIQGAVQAHPEGTSFLLLAGVHRLQTISPKSGNAFHGELDASCKRLSTLNGARLLTSWTKQGVVWVHAGQDQQGQVHGDCEAGWERCKYPEDLYFDDVPLQHVGTAAAVGPGKWYFDYDADSVHLGDDPSGHTVELGTARVAFAPSATPVRIQSLIVEKYAIPAQMGAIGDQYPKADWHIENNEVRLNHGTGINVGSGSVVARNHVHHNGQKGVGASGVDVLVDHNEIAFNNYARFDAGWEAGGTKFSNTTGLIVRGNCVHHNHGPGLWTDIDNQGVLYEKNAAFSNRSMGIFHEISFDAVIRDNVVADNGEEFAWLYGAQILVSTSKNVDVYGNRVVVSATHGNAIGVVWQDRGPKYAGTGNSLHDNDVTFLGDAPIWQGVPGQMGVAADFEPATTEAFQQSSMSSNTYRTKSGSARHFAWNNASLTFAELQAAGQEAKGQLLPGGAPLALDCTLVPDP